MRVGTLRSTANSLSDRCFWVSVVCTNFVGFDEIILVSERGKVVILQLEITWYGIWRPIYKSSRKQTDREHHFDTQQATHHRTRWRKIFNSNFVFSKATLFGESRLNGELLTHFLCITGLDQQLRLIAPNFKTAPAHRFLIFSFLV